MIRRIVLAARLFLAVQWRCGFPAVYVGTTLVTVAAFRLALPPEYWEWLVPVFLFAEPGILGFTLVSAQMYLQRGEGSATALAVTPLRNTECVAALTVSSALVASLCGLVVQGGVLGLDLRVGWLVAPLFLTASLSGLVGLGLSARFDDFSRFLVGGLMPGMVILQLPLLSYFEWLPRPALAWLPTDAALYAIASASSGDPSPSHGGYVALLIGYNAIALVWASSVFGTRIRDRLEVG